MLNKFHDFPGLEIEIINIMTHTNPVHEPDTFAEQSLQLSNISFTLSKISLQLSYISLLIIEISLLHSDISTTKYCAAREILLKA